MTWRLSAKDDTREVASPASLREMVQNYRRKFPMLP